MLASKSRPGKKREAVLDAALGLFTEKGYAGTSTRDIASRAKVNEVTVFRHFGTKRALFEAAIDRCSELGPSFDGIPAPRKGDPEGTIVDMGWYVHGEMRSRARMSHLLLVEGRRASLRNIAKKVPAQGLSEMTERFRALGAKDPEMAALAFMSFIMRSVLFSEVAGKDPLMVMDRKALRRFAKILVRGMM